MNNTQLILVIAMPSFTVLVGILVNLVQISGIRSDLASLRTEVHSLTGKIIELVDRVSRLEARTEH
jgi:hypothetical protein